MIASYKIDEICHKNEDVCFIYACFYIFISSLGFGLFSLLCSLSLLHLLWIWVQEQSANVTLLS